MVHYSGLSELPAYPRMPSNPLSFFFFFLLFCLKDFHYYYFFNQNSTVPLSSPAVLHRKPHGTFLDICNPQKPAALPFL